MRLAALIDHYRIGSNAKPDSFRHYKIAADQFSRFLGERNAPVSALTDDNISLFVKSLEAAGKSPHTANGKRTHLMVLAKHAIAEGFLNKPLRKVVKLTTPKRIPDSWSPEQVGMILKACEAEPMDAGFGPLHWKLCVLLAYDTTARKRALLLTTREDVINGRLRLRHETQKRENEQLIDISADSLDLIAQIGVPEGGRLLPWPYRIETFDRRFGAILERAGLPSGRRHKLQKLRRTGVTQAAVVFGVDAASFRAGHADRSMTVTRYLDQSKLPSDVAGQIARPALTGG